MKARPPALPGTDFGAGADFVYELPQDLVDAVGGVLGTQGTIVFESCQNTDMVTLEDYRNHAQDLADQLGYDVYVAYGDTIFHDPSGAQTDGQWVLAEPTN